MKSDLLTEIKERIIGGIPATVDEAIELNSHYTTDELCEAADEIRRHCCGQAIDTCSIVNARSGRCPENCKWCAQSAHHNTGIEEYDIISEEKLLEAAGLNSRHGVKRFSLVTSGRAVGPKMIGKFCALYSKVGEKYPGLFLCASMGLLGEAELKALYESGVRRYHCNLETSSSFFHTLCTTHTHADKLRTIAAARKAGMEVCSGGIIGMGETMRHRLEMASEARDAGAVSIPVNILQPIKGTPLENTPLISEDEIIRTGALFRFIAPKATLRFAGGRARLSQATAERMLRGGINGALVGDLLTTIGNTLSDDRSLFRRTGYTEIPD